MLQEKLKHHTTAMHSQLEQLMHTDQIMARTLTPEMYDELLITNYLAHQRYEQAVFSALDEQAAKKLDLGQRAKLGALEQDLEDRGINKQDLLESGISTERINGNAFALGALYVMEGATLGGSVIVKQLRLNSNFPADQKFSYYGCYGKELISKWQQFLAVLNALPEEQHPAAIEGAEFMFKNMIGIAERVAVKSTWQ